MTVRFPIVHRFSHRVRPQAWITGPEAQPCEKVYWSGSIIHMLFQTETRITTAISGVLPVMNRLTTNTTFFYFNKDDVTLLSIGGE